MTARTVAPCPKQGAAGPPIPPHDPWSRHVTTDPQTDLFVPPAAEGLPLAALDSATEGANRLDAWALDPRGRNFLAHALVQLARDGWLRAEPGTGFEPVRVREAVTEPQEPPASVPSAPVDRGAFDAELSSETAPKAASKPADRAAEFELRGTAEIRGAVLREAADELGRMDYDTDSNDYGYDTYRDAWSGGVMDGADLLRRRADEEQQPETQAPGHARPTRYSVNLVPEDADPGGTYEITVEYRGDERWAVLRHGSCLSADGRWDRERNSSERDEEWLDAHRYDLKTALRLAEEQATDIAPAKWRGRATTPQHVGGNAEACPACHGTNPPYPFICPGPPAAVAQPGKEA